MPEFILDSATLQNEKKNTHKKADTNLSTLWFWLNICASSIPHTHCEYVKMFQGNGNNKMCICFALDKMKNGRRDFMGSKRRQKKKWIVSTDCVFVANRPNKNDGHLQWLCENIHSIYHWCKYFYSYRIKRRTERMNCSSICLDGQWS